jgi:hypothetical protein
VIHPSRLLARPPIPPSTQAGSLREFDFEAWYSFNVDFMPPLLLNPLRDSISLYLLNFPYTKDDDMLLQKEHKRSECQTEALLFLCALNSNAFHPSRIEIYNNTCNYPVLPPRHPRSPSMHATQRTQSPVFQSHYLIIQSSNPLI